MLDNQRCDNLFGCLGMEIIIVTGKVNSGKTTLMQQIVDEARAKGEKISGILALGSFEQDRKSGFNVKDVQTGKIKPLASACKKDSQGFSIGRFNFFKDGFDFAQRSLLSFKPNGTVFLDEVGPLELMGRGYAACLKEIFASDIKKLYVVVREDCLNDFMQVFLSGRELSIKYLNTNRKDFRTLESVHA